MHDNAHIISNELYYFYEPWEKTMQDNAHIISNELYYFFKLFWSLLESVETLLHIYIYKQQLL